jgi:FkbM family methyltransferase
MEAYKGRTVMILEKDIKWLGTEYGGFYVVPKLIKKNGLALCAGIGEDISFDIQLIGLYNMKVVGIDPTIKSKYYIEKLNIKNYFFEEQALVSESFSENAITIYENKNPEWVSESIINSHNSVGENNRKVSALRISELIKKYGNFDLIKLDVEGAEYDIINDFLNENINKINCNHFCIEFHHHCCEKFTITDTKNIVNKFIERGYIPITKNWKEITFIKA